MLTQSELKSQLSYNKDTGIFTWKINKSRLAKIGNIAGSLHNNGYYSICINNKQYLAHRLAWLYISGEMPKNNIDHIDNNKINNKINNLREATKSQNEFNTKLRNNNSSGFKGVCLDKRKNLWYSSSCINNKRTFLGCFKTAQLASVAYINFTKKHHGEFFYE